MVTKSNLSKSQQQLVELMQRLHFGRIETLQICAGQPVFQPPPRVFQKVKIGADNELHFETAAEDFRLKRPVVEMLDLITKLGDGTVSSVEVRFGLPVFLEIEQASPMSRGRDA